VQPLARTSDQLTQVSVAPTVPYTVVVNSDSPFAWWRLGEASSLFADHGLRYPGSANGTLTRAVTGAIAGDSDGAVTFNGSTGFISLPVYPRPSLIMTPPGASVFNADTQPNKATWAAADGSAVTIQAYWDRLQTTQGAALVGAEVTALNTQISDARALNLEVILEIALQYPPTWALSAIAQFKDQSGTSYSGSSGENVRDWIFTSNGRTQVADYISKVLAAVTNLNTNVDRMRIGGGFFGELHYPRNGAGPNYQVWAYGTAPQTGTGLASDQTTCPLPGYVPFYDASRTDAKDAQFLNWYWQSLGNFGLWLIDQHRSQGYQGPLHVLHPGGGVRSNQVWTNAQYQQSAAAGEHPSFMMDVYKNRLQVYPSCTYLDNADNGSPPATDSDKAAWRKVRDEANARGIGSDLWGENVGGNDATAMTYIMGATGPMQNGYRGLTWLNFASLSPSGPLAQLTTALRAQRNAVTAAGALTCWAKLPNNPAANGGLMGWRNDTTADFYMLQLSGTNTIECRFRNSSGAAFTFTSSALTANVYHFLQLVLNGSTLTLYSDTVQVGSVGGISGKMANAGLFQLGKIAGNFFAGTIDEPAIYDYALTP
jgi:hypothetical protein